MFTEDNRKTKNWRSAKRMLRKARNKKVRLEKKLKDGRHTVKDKPMLKEELTDTKVHISVLELKIGDRPE